MTTAERAKNAVLERVAILAHDATMLDLFPLTDAIMKMTGEDYKHFDKCFEILSGIISTGSEAKGGKK